MTPSDPDEIPNEDMLLVNPLLNDEVKELVTSDETDEDAPLEIEDDTPLDTADDVSLLNDDDIPDVAELVAPLVPLLVTPELVALEIEDETSDETDEDVSLVTLELIALEAPLVSPDDIPDETLELLPKPIVSTTPPTASPTAPTAPPSSCACAVSIDRLTTVTTTRNTMVTALHILGCARNLTLTFRNVILYTRTRAI